MDIIDRRMTYGLLWKEAQMEKKQGFLRLSGSNFKNSLGLAFNFNLLVEVLFGLLYIPASSYLFELAIQRNNLDYFTNRNFLVVLKDPPVILAFLALMFLMMIFSLYRMTTMYTLVSEPEIKTIRGLLRRSLARFIKRLRKHKPLEAILLIVLHPIANITFIISLYYRYGLDRFLQLDRYNIAPILLLLLIGNSIFMFTYPMVFLEGVSFRKALVNGWHLFRHHWLRNLFYFLMAMLLATAAILGVYLVLIVLFTLINQNRTNFGIYGMYLTALQVIQSGVALAMVVVFSVINSFFVSQLYIYCLTEDQSISARVRVRRGGELVHWIYSVIIMTFIFAVSIAGPLYFRNTYTKYGGYFFKTYPEIIAHRGFSSKAPENTLPAIRTAIRAKADRIEIDVQLSKDGVVYLMHDKTLKRTTGRKERLSELTSYEIDYLDAGSWYSPDYAGIKVPKLEEVLKECKGRTALKIELKPDKVNEWELASAVVKEVKKAGMSDNVMISSFNKNIVRKVRKLDDTIISGLIVNVIYGKYGGIDYAEGIVINQNNLTLEQTANMQKSGKLVYAWTPNSYEDLRTMTRYGVDGIITDYPQRARVVVYGETLDITVKNMIFNIIISLSDPLRS